ncbi:hypothetical protein [Pseudactinotalea sp.]|uniref:hypothetical protein n=1 Tax=Pseudactinotalea sp. TaxID=1926260 RepID=UPI003B3AE110
MTDERSLDDLLREAADELRASTDTGWQRAHERILRGLLITLRPSTPVRGTSEEGGFRVASTVLVGLLRARLDERSDLQVLRVSLETDEHDALTGIVLAISIAYPGAISTVAEAAREATREIVLQTLGDQAEVVDIVVADVHTLSERDLGDPTPT